MKKHLLYIILLLIPLFSLSQETIVLKDSSKIQCAMTNTDSLNNYLDVIEDDNLIHTYVVNKNEVAWVNYENKANKVINNKKVTQHKFVIKNEVYPKMVLSICEPPANSLRLKTDIGHWFGLYPNIGVEYRINRYLALNAEFTNKTTGIKWPTFVYDYALSQSNQNIMSIREQWALKGKETSAGIKFYPSKQVFIAIQYSYASLSFPIEKQYYGTGDESAYNFTEEKMSRFDDGVKILFGMENKGTRCFFNEWYLGYGISYEKTNQVIYGVYNHELLPGNYPEVINSNKKVSSIILGYNIGIKTSSCSFLNSDSNTLNKLFINSLDISLNGINYERILLKIYPLYISGQIGTSKIMINPLLQFSNSLCLEAGYGLLYSEFWNSFSIGLYKYPFWICSIGLRYMGYKGLFIKGGFQFAWNTDYKNVSVFVPELGIGYSFGKTK